MQRDVVERYLGGAGIPIELLGEPHARVTEEQFSTLYRTLAIELDDEMPGIFAPAARRHAEVPVPEPARCAQP